MRFSLATAGTRGTVALTVVLAVVYGACTISLRCRCEIRSGSTESSKRLNRPKRGPGVTVLLGGRGWQILRSLEQPPTDKAPVDGLSRTLNGLVVLRVTGLQG